MGGVLSSNNVAPQNPDSELIKSRLDAHRRKAREEIDSMLKALEAKQRDLHYDDPLDPSRPYGLGEGMEGFRRHIWELIFVHVNDLDTIVSLREVCMMFRDLLEMKYKATRLPEVIVKCLERKIIHWEHIFPCQPFSNNGTTERSNWVKTLERLRFISKTTKNSVDLLFDRGMLALGSREREDEAGMFCGFCYSRGGVHYASSEYKTEERKIPTLTFGAKEADQARLKRTLEILENDEASVGNFSVRALVFDDCRRGGSASDLWDLHDHFLECLKKIGHKISSFRYKSYSYRTTENDYMYAYNNLRKWLPHMPNLEELMVDPELLRCMPYTQLVDQFVTCPKLKRFAEGISRRQFDYRYIVEILKANPTIEAVLLRQTPTSAAEIDILNQALQCVHLKKLYMTNTPSTISFFDYTFQDQWALRLTHFILRDFKQYPNSAEKNPSDKVFAFLSKFKNLKVLGIMSKGIRDAGGYLQLPKLESVYLEVFSDFKSLEFLKHAEDLKWLYLDFRPYPNDPLLEGNLMQYLGKYNIPSLFPALRMIEMKRMLHKTIWRPSNY